MSILLFRIQTFLFMYTYDYMSIYFVYTYIYTSEYIYSCFNFYGIIPLSLSSFARSRISGSIALRYKPNNSLKL